MADGQKQHTRAGSRHPIQLHEIAHLEALGNRLATVRHDRGFTQAGLAQKAELSTSAIGRIESGTRRTRRSTLERIAIALGSPNLADELARLAGPALAPESPHAERIAAAGHGVTTAVGDERNGHSARRGSARSPTLSGSCRGKTTKRRTTSDTNATAAADHCRATVAQTPSAAPHSLSTKLFEAALGMVCSGELVQVIGPATSRV
jgi:transcriptional regulator with XRE-family HTH domain